MSATPKKIADAIRAASGHLKNRNTTAIIVAAGSSTRMGGAVPKQFLVLSGMPVVVHAMRAYEESEYIDNIIVVAREEDAKSGCYEKFAEKFAITKFIGVVVGGKTRQESVLRGVEAVPSSTRYVAIADGARPLTLPGTINSVCLAAYRFGAATAAMKIVDTLKAEKKMFISTTVDRDSTWGAATPQVFSLAIYRAAAYYALDNSFVGTDDNSLVENIDRNVRIVECPRDNIKITEPMDLAVAEALLAFRREEIPTTEEGEV